MDDSTKCKQCKPSKCCLYITVQVASPKRLTDFEEMLWHTAHQDVEYFVQKRKWYVMIHNPCRFLNTNSNCEIYENRPQVCRDHNPENCEFETGCDFDLHITSYEEMLEFAARRFPSLRSRQDDPALER